MNLQKNCWIQYLNKIREILLMRKNCGNSKIKLFILVVFLFVPLVFSGMMPLKNGHAAEEKIEVAKVNGIPIYKSELDRIVAFYKKKTGKKEITKEEKESLLKNIIHRYLILNQDTAKALRNDKVIRAKTKEYENNLIVSRYLGLQIGTKLNVTDEEIKKYYEKNRHFYLSPYKVEARHILLRTRKEAEEVLKKLRNGEDFGELVKKYSIDLPSVELGGSMGLLEKGRTLPELEKVVFTLKVGEISDIVKTKYGYHIIVVDRIFTPEPKPLALVKDEIRKAIMREKEAKAYDEMVKRLEKHAKIEIFENRLLPEKLSSLNSREKNTPFSRENLKMK